MFGLGIPEVVLISVIGLIFFGPKKLPELARGFGQGIREFRQAASETKEKVTESISGSE